MSVLKKLKFHPDKGGSLMVRSAKKLAKIAPYVIAIASLVAAVTPNQSDDAFVQRLIEVSHVMALNVGNARPQLPYEN